MTDVEDRPKVTELKREAPKATDNDAWVLQISLKTARGAMINIRGANPFDLAANLEAIRGMIGEILEAEAELFGQGGGQQVPPALQALGAQPVAPSFVPQQPQQGGQGQQSNAPLCQHNLPAKYVQGGMSKTGRPYRAFWACPLDREQQCSFRANA